MSGVNNVYSKKNWQKKKILASKIFQDKAFEEVNELIIKERKGRKLILNDGVVLTDFISCSYLGLDLDQRIIGASFKNIHQCGVTFPAARTRAKIKSFCILEELLNKIFCNSFTTIFTSLHLAHLGILPLIASGELPSFPIKGDNICFVLDEKVHASIQINRGLMNQFGEIFLTDFRQIEKLEKLFSKLKKNNKTFIAIADSIGSMGGTISIREIYALAEKYDGYLYLDDAHGTSVFGNNGCGYALHCFDGVFPKRLILASSLAKAFGSIGGVIAMPTKKDAIMIKKFCQTYIFGGPPALSSIDSAIASAEIHLTGEIKCLQDKLWSNVKYFDDLFGEKIFNFLIQSPIRGLFIGDELEAINYAKFLQKNGIAVTTALYPTVEKGKSLLRFALSATHTKNEINQLYSNISGILKC